ncbi:MAG: hypothetical protein Kow0067_18220 [Coriobacteriia bacterium]
MPGVIRTRVGYAGGTTPDPTYRRIGDHTETVQIDYDPATVGFEDLLDVFWTSHRPTSPAYSRQYASIIFPHDEKQRAAAEASRTRMEAVLGVVHTDIVPFTRFYVAEDYHQKYRLRGARALMAEFAEMYPDPADFRESTAAARVNGYLDGWGDTAALEAEIDGYGLSEDGQERLRDAVRPRRGLRL